MKTKIRLNTAGVRELLRCEDMQAMLSERATEIAKRAGDGYETNVFVGKNRANASVFAADPKTAREDMKNNTLLKAVR